MSARKCKLCPATIEFIEGPNGKPIPVQRLRTIYTLSNGKLAKVEIAGAVYVSHYETCSNPRAFSRRGAPARGGS